MQNTGHHLKTALAYFVAWLVIVLLLVKELRGEAVTVMLTAQQDGNYMPVLLLTASIVLLALSLSSLARHLSQQTDQSN